MGNAVHFQVLTQLPLVCDTAVAERATMTLTQYFCHVLGWRLCSDSDVDLALRHHVVCDLIVLTASKTVFLEIFAREDVVDIALVNY